MPPLLVWLPNPPTPGGDIQMHVIWDLGNPTTQSGTLGHISSSPSKIHYELGDSQAGNEAFFCFPKVANNIVLVKSNSSFVR